MATPCTILIPRRMVSMERTAARLITTREPEHTAYRRQRTDLMVPRLAPRPTTLIREHRREPLRHRRPMANRVWARRTTRTPDRMAQLIKDRAPRRNGDNHTSLKETNPPRHSTIQRRMERWLRPRGRKVGKAMRHPARMETRTRGRTRVATCMQDTTGMCTKTQVLDGRNRMGMEAGLM
jgi:hypothetical protein